MSKESRQIRVVWRLADAKRDRGNKQPKEVTAVRNVSYGKAGKWNLLDLYYPTELQKTQKLPVIVSIHGGGYVYGTKTIYQFYMMDLAKRGFATVNFNYRLAPENRFPCALEDTNLVIKWIIDNTEKYNLDLSRVYMVGDSAGAHYASLYAALCVNKDYARELNITPPDGFCPNALGLNCGCYDIDGNFDENGVNKSPLLNDLLGKGFDAENAKKLLNLRNWITSDFPPSFVMTSYYDFLRPQLPEIEKLFKDNNIECVAKVYGDETTKEATHVFHVNVKLELGRLCNDEQCKFFLSH